MIVEGFLGAGDLLRSGVYALVHKGKIVYIGKSKVMLVRIYQHRNNWSRKKRENLPWLKGILFDDIYIRPCPLELLDTLEYEMINLYKPKYNVLLKQPGERPATLVVNGRVLSLAQPEPSPAEPFERRV